MQTASMQYPINAFIPANQFAEYLLVAVPGPELYDKILFEQQVFDQHYLTRNQGKAKLQIEVAGFQAKEEMEPTLLRWMHRIFASQQAFCVPLSNYSGIPGDAVYLRVPESKPFQQLGQALDPLNDYIKTCDCPNIRVNPKPNLPIARQLGADTYSKAMMDYSSRSFHEMFEVRELVLLRRKHLFDPYTQVNKFVLQPA